MAEYQSIINSNNICDNVLELTDELEVAEHARALATDGSHLDLVDHVAHHVMNVDCLEGRVERDLPVEARVAGHDVNL